MKLLCLHPYLSMRAVKEMFALTNLGHKVVLAYEGLGCSVEKGIGSFWDEVIKIPSNQYKGDYFLRRLFPISYKNVIKKLTESNQYDLIHTYSMPDTLALAAVRYSKLPVVFDSRDVTSAVENSLISGRKITHVNRALNFIYKKLILKYEKEVNENADGRVYVSTEMMKYINHVYNINNEKSIVLPNYQVSALTPNKRIPKLSEKDSSTHIVYVGNITYDYFEKVEKLFKTIANQSIHLHLYHVGDKTLVTQAKSILQTDPFIHFHNPLTPKDLLVEIQQYDYGLLPYSPDRQLLNYQFALPNKLF